MSGLGRESGGSVAVEVDVEMRGLYGRDSEESALEETSNPMGGGGGVKREQKISDWVKHLYGSDVGASVLGEWKHG